MPIPPPPLLLLHVPRTHPGRTPAAAAAARLHPHLPHPHAPTPRSGAEEIKSHPWFKGINWALLRNDAPPYVPRRQSKGPAAAAGGNGAAGAPAGAPGQFDNY